MAYWNGDMRLNAASRTYNVPKVILQIRAHSGNINAVNHDQAFGRCTDTDL